MGEELLPTESSKKTKLPISVLVGDGRQFLRKCSLYYLYFAELLEQGPAREGYSAKAIVDWARKDGRQIDGLRYFDDHISRHPSRAAAYFNRGLLHHDLAQYAKAETDFSRSIELGYRPVNAWFNRGQSRLMLAQYEVAIEDYDVALSMKPRRVDILLARALARMNLRQFASARKDLILARHLAPRNPLVPLYFGYLWDCQSSFDLAVISYSQVIELNPKFAEAYYRRGGSWEMLKESNTTSSASDALVAIGRRAYAHSTQLRGIMESTEDCDLALEDFDQAVKVAPKDSRCYFLRGQLWQRRGRVSMALADFDQAIHLNSNSFEYFGYRASTLLGTGDAEQALLDCNAALLLSPGSALILHHRAHCYTMLRDFERSLDDLREAASLSQDSPDMFILNGLAWILATCPDDRLRNGYEAIEYATKACTLSEWKVAGIIDTLAAAYAENGDFEEAVYWQDRALTLVEADKKAKCYATLLLYLKGQPVRDMGSAATPNEEHLQSSPVNLQ